MAEAGPRTRTINKRQLEMREKLWPGLRNAQLWMRRERDGFSTVPRVLPLMMSIMDDLAGKGTPVGQTYFELWCRLYDESFLVLNRHEEMAFHAGFSGQRAVRTWRDRIRILAKLGFLDVLPGPSGDLSYALFWNPYHVLKRHNEAGLIQHAKWLTLEVRATEIKATDLEMGDADRPDPVPVPPAPPISFAALLATMQPPAAVVPSVPAVVAPPDATISVPAGSFPSPSPPPAPVVIEDEAPAPLPPAAEGNLV
jgi:hypothetical protein